MNKLQKFQTIFAIVLFCVGGFFGGYYFGVRGYEIQIKKNPVEVKINNKNHIPDTVDMELFWKVWDRMHKEYLERPVDSQKMIYGAISGMVKALGDPYTSFLTPDENKVINNTLAGVYEGIGAELDIKDGILIIVSPLDGSPAQAAGLKPQDRILQIDGQSAIGTSVTEAVSKIRGADGTSVTLTIKSGEDPMRDVKVTRGKIKIESVTWKDLGEGTAYIRISRFGGDTPTEWTKVVSEINVKMSELDALVIDLRSNPGGYMGAAIYIASEFYDGKPVLYQEDAEGTQVALKADRKGQFGKLPATYVLVDGGSASASEILAAALRDTVGAKLVGVKSFGKGTIQDTDNYPDGSGIHITIAKWLTPNKEWVHKKGLEPDVVVELDQDQFTKGVDTQLDKAKELAKEF